MTKSQSLLVSKFEPDLGLGDYGLDYITVFGMGNPKKVLEVRQNYSSGVSMSFFKY